MLILPKAHLTSHSKISGCRGVITPSWLSGSLRPFLYSSVCIWLWGWAIHSCCSSHLWHFWKGVPVIHQCRELEAPCCNDLDSMRGPVFSLDSLSCIIPAFSAVSAGALPGVLLLKPEHPAPTRNSGHECKPLLSWEVLFGNELCGEFSWFAFWAPVPLFPSEVPKLPLVLTYEEISACPGTFPPSQFPPQSAGPHPQIFFFFFFLIFIFCPTSFWEDWLSFLDVKDLLLAFRTYSVWADPLADVFFMYLWGGGWSPHLIPPPSWKSPHLLVIKFKPWELTLTYFLYLVYSLKYP